MNKKFASIIIVNIFLTMVQIILSSTRSADGITLASVEYQSNALKKSITILNNQISQRTDLGAIETSAKSRGFVPITTSTLELPVMAKK